MLRSPGGQGTANPPGSGGVGSFALEGFVPDFDAVPVGNSSAGLPISMQLVGRFFDDTLLLRVTHAYQHATDRDKIIRIHA